MMSLDASKTADLRVKHLEMLQGVISRIAGQGATLKNYCLTLITALCGFAITLQKPLVALLALFPIAIFALLDAQYLRLERRFRRLFDTVRTGDWGVVPDFEISIASAPNSSYWAALLSWSIATFYVPLAVAVVLMVVIARQIYGGLA
jgi:hypothetical protein